MSHRILMALILCAQLFTGAVVNAQEQLNTEKSVTTAVLPPSLINKSFNNNETTSQSNLNDTLTNDGFIRVSNRNMADMVIFTQPKQVFSGKMYGMDWQATASVGTVMSHKPGGLILHTGHLLISSGKSPLKVINNCIEISIPANTTVIIDSKDGKVVEVLSLSTKSENINIKTSRINNGQMQLAAGQKIVIGDLAQLMTADLSYVVNNDVLLADVSLKGKSKDILSKLKAEIIHAYAADHKIHTVASSNR